MQKEKESIAFLIKLLDERDRQDERWGLEHDNKHINEDWLDFIECQINKIEYFPYSNEEFRERMVKIAALAMAAYQSNLRKNEVN